MRLPLHLRLPKLVLVLMLASGRMRENPQQLEPAERARNAALAR